MSIASEISRIQSGKNSLKTKINAKNDEEHQITNETIDKYGGFVQSIPVGKLTNEEYTEAINDCDSILNGTIVPSGTINITQNGEIDVTNYVNANVNVISDVVVEKDVNFYDYDGTLVASYTKADFNSLTAMPDAPIHTGLTFQEWNWTLVDAKEFMETNTFLNIGANYKTTSDLCEFDIEVTKKTGLTFSFNNLGEKNWGDGTTDNLGSHTYTNYGTYTVTIDTTTIYAGGGDYTRHVRLSNKVTTLSNSAFNGCNCLETISVPNTITSMGTSLFSNAYMLKAFMYSSGIQWVSNGTFNNCFSLKIVSIPKTVYSIVQNGFYNCENLKNISLTKTVTGIGNSSFGGCVSLSKIGYIENVTSIAQNAFSMCHELREFKVPKGVTTINQNTFNATRSIMKYDFSDFEAVPTLSNTNAFLYINRLAKIIVPDSLYTDWIGASNWSSYADYIYKVSEVV